MLNGARIVAAALTAVVLGSLASCGGQSPYCAAVDENQSDLDTFLADKSDAGITTYATAVTSISKVAPAPIDEQWTSLARATQGVLTAHDDVGFALEDMKNEKARTALSEADTEVLNKAYKRFNGTTPQRKAVVADVKKACDIQLK
jgi:hypothetical protein